MEEGRTLAQAAAVFKLNIDTFIGRRKRYRQKTQVRRPVNKKIIPEKHNLFDNCAVEQGF